MTVYVLGAIGIGLVWLLGVLCGWLLVVRRIDAHGDAEFERGFRRCAEVPCGRCGWVVTVVV